MAEYNKKIVFFLDILGFKNIIEKNEFSVDEMKEHFNHMNYFTNYKKWIESKIPNGAELSHVSGKTKVSQFSDSIVISIDYNDISTLYYCISDVMELQANFAAIHGIFFRGSCSSGLMYHESDLFFGPALNDAVEMEKVAKYPRIIIPNKVINQFDATPISNFLKLDKDGYMYINYINYQPREDEDGLGFYNDKTQYMKDLKIKIQKGLEDQVALDKYIWLKNKYNEALIDKNENQLTKIE